MQAQPPSIARGPLTVWEIRLPLDLAAVRNSMCVQAKAFAPDADGAGPLLASAAERLGLVFSELATNALRHGAHPVTATLARTFNGWLVTVSDGGTEERPTLRDAQPHRPGGHGLRLVVRLSTAVGWYRLGALKHVWADVPDVPPAQLMSALGAAR